jgi:hypothetical protein
MYASQTVQYQVLSFSNLMLESPCWNPAGVAMRSKQLWRAQFDDLGRASIRSISPRPKRRHEPSAWRALRDWESTKFPESWLICKLPASQSRTDFNLRPTISATSRDLALISSIPGPATNDGERCDRRFVFATSAPPPQAAKSLVQLGGFEPPTSRPGARPSEVGPPPSPAGPAKRAAAKPAAQVKGGDRESVSIYPSMGGDALDQDWRRFGDFAVIRRKPLPSCTAARFPD